ncbi:hypothetical protein [Ralstonia phage RSP15]|uniref:hypothetical protein n=1 Tax=Ralstonia phage RSP15 TaxID=1785960 RepID=UPI00074D2C6E|nr:hypothetical protein BH754_gp143 [Ralstonia phage RSP15]BAU40163.1 hypothetical protein [Ralstonia phage RSP15]
MEGMMSLEQKDRLAPLDYGRLEDSPSNYQWQYKGKAIPVSEMSEEELRYALCEAMDTLHNMGDAVKKAKKIFKFWVDGMK